MVSLSYFLLLHITIHELSEHVPIQSFQVRSLILILALDDLFDLLIQLIT